MTRTWKMIKTNPFRYILRFHHVVRTERETILIHILIVMSFCSNYRNQWTPPNQFFPNHYNLRPPAMYRSHQKNQVRVKIIQITVYQVCLNQIVLSHLLFSPIIIIVRPEALLCVCSLPNKLIEHFEMLPIFILFFDRFGF